VPTQSDASSSSPTDQETNAAQALSLLAGNTGSDCLSHGGSTHDDDVEVLADIKYEGVDSLEEGPACKRFRVSYRPREAKSTTRLGIYASTVVAAAVHDEYRVRVGEKAVNRDNVPAAQHAEYDQAFAMAASFVHPPRIQLKPNSKLTRHRMQYK
jgi:hypothetical protein